MNITGSTAQAPDGATAAQPLSFVEHACYGKGEVFNPQLEQVAFRLFSVGRGLGKKLDVSFYDDYGIYYGDDSQLVAALAQAAPGVAWAGYVYHRWLDQSRVQVLEPNTGKILAQIETRRYHGRRVQPAAVAAGQHGTNVVTLCQLRAARIQRAVAQLSADRKQREGEGESSET